MEEHFKNINSFLKVMSAPDYEIKVILQRSIFDLEKKYNLPKEEVINIIGLNYSKLQKELGKDTK